MTDTMFGMIFMQAPCCLSRFNLFRAALAPVQLLTWPHSAGASPGLLGASELGNLCAAAAQALLGGGF